MIPVDTSLWIAAFNGKSLHNDSDFDLIAEHTLLLVKV